MSDTVASVSVSIITVVRNNAQTISRTIESVLNQTIKPTEYFILDGCSDDDTVSIATSYQEKFAESGIIYKVISEKDNGMYDALNKGNRLASSVLIGQLNADDWYEPTAIKDMIDLYLNEHYDIAWGDILIKRPQGDIRKKARIGKLWTTAGFCHPSMFSRRQILLQYPYACEAMDDDFDMVTRAHKAGVKICTINHLITNYSFGGMSTKKSLKNTFFRIRMKYHTYRKNGYSPLYWFYCVAMEMAKFILG